MTDNINQLLSSLPIDRIAGQGLREEMCAFAACRVKGNFVCSPSPATDPG